MAPFVYSRLITLAAASVGTVNGHVPLNRVFQSWDGTWYFAVMTTGYPHGIPQQNGKALSTTVGFFPLFPDVVSFVHTVTRLPFFGAAVLVTTISGAAAASLVWLLVHERFDTATADRACTLWCFFPASFVLTLFYADTLLMALAFGCLLALLRHRWWLAGILAALATATRPNAIVIVACCAWAAAVAIWRRKDWGALAAPLLAPAGLLAFCSFLWLRTGSFLAFYRVQHDGWGQQLDPTTAYTEITYFVQHPFSNSEDIAEVAALVFVAIAAVIVVRTRPPPILLIWTAGIIGFALLSSISGIRARYILTAFPLVTAPAVYLRGKAYASYLAVSAAVLGYLTAISVSTLMVTP